MSKSKIDNVKLEQQHNSNSNVEASSVCPTCTKPFVRRSAFVVYNINGDVIGVASTHKKAEQIFAEQYGDFDSFVAITEFEIDRLHFA